MPEMIILRDAQIDAPLTRLFTLCDTNDLSKRPNPIAGIDWIGVSNGKGVYSAQITILKDGTTINYDGTLIGEYAEGIDGTLTLSPAAKWYTNKNNNAQGQHNLQNLKAGQTFGFATPFDPSGNDGVYYQDRSLSAINSSLRLNNFSAFVDSTMQGSCMDMRIGMSISSLGSRVLVAQAAIDYIS